MTVNASILCAVDLSPGSERVLGQAAEMAKAMGAELTLLYVYPPPLLPLEEGDAEDGEEVVRLLAKIKRKLVNLSEPFREHGVKIKAVTREGDPSDTIVDESRNGGARLIVVGTHGRSAFKQLVLGSTAERVVRMSRLPVLVVPEAS